MSQIAGLHFTQEVKVCKAWGQKEKEEAKENFIVLFLRMACTCSFYGARQTKMKEGKKNLNSHRYVKIVIK